MTSKSSDIREIFNQLSEKNKDILILLAKSIKLAQEVERQSCKPSK